MITHHDVAVAEYLIKETGAADVLYEGMLRSSRGRKPNRQAFDLLLIGLFLSIQNRGVATVQGAFRALTEEMPLDERVRIGTRFLEDGKMKSLDDRTLYNQVERIRDRLAYGELSTPDLDDVERERRRQAILKFSATLLDAFMMPGWTPTVYAMDATGVWSWGRGGKRREDMTPDRFEGEDEAVVNELIELSQHGEGPEPDDDLDEPRTDDAGDRENPKRLRRRRRDRTIPRKRPAGSNQKSAKHDDGLGYTTSIDPDADWGIKTSKSGRRETFFGYHEHTIVIAPEGSVEEFPNALPPLVRRLELTPASQDIVDVSLRLIDSLGTVEHLLVDSHYHYKGTDRWLDELIKRGIYQHHDLRSDEQGFVSHERILYAAGWPHCPCTDMSLGTIPKPGPGASVEEKEKFSKQVNRRYSSALRLVNQPSECGTYRGQCPALAGKVGCPLRPGTVETANELGLPVMENVPNEEIDGEPLPRICVQETATYTPPNKVRKLQQPHYWGSKIWGKMFNRRTSVEGSYGNRKNVSTENLRRGLFQSMGLPWSNIVDNLVAAVYDLRVLQNWHDRTGEGDPNHILLQRGERGRPWMYLSEEEAERLEVLFMERLGVREIPGVSR